MYMSYLYSLYVCALYIVCNCWYKTIVTIVVDVHFTYSVIHSADLEFFLVPEIGGRGFIVAL